ncbi:MAG: NADH:flavin oxidoreductase [Desulfobacterota bacterium]|nr:NADH:flavin oxidoreductase [Thermodesulfobacteriota bacterium]
MRHLFETTWIKGLQLPNRFVRSATWEGMATPKGAVSPKLVETMIRLARGGVGLIITGHAYVRPEGQASPFQLGIHQDDLVHGLQEMTQAVHAQGGKIVLQLSHAGRFAWREGIGRPPLVVSGDGSSSSPVEELTKPAIQELVQAFAEAARRAKTAGFDGIQIHSAHGYLLNQFLSPAFNRRQDEYGGDLRNRVRVHLEICEALRKVVGEDYPILIKLNGRDFIENGLSLEESVQIGKILARGGIDAIELSGGMIIAGKFSPSRQGIDSREKEAYFQEEAKVMRGEVGIPLILVGGIRSFEVAEKLLQDGVADYISMSRPLIRDPDLILRWKRGERHRSACRSDNLCFKPGREGEGVYCVVRAKEEGAS